MFKKQKLAHTHTHIQIRNSHYQLVKKEERLNRTH